MSQPNILVIMVDQLTALALSCYGHGVVKTPNIDRLAAEGVVFENAYCNSPLCAPSRASMLTGQLPSRIGAYDNAAAFSPDTPTIAHVLRQAGYTTTLCGKMHMVGPDQLHGFEERLTTDIYPSDYGWTPDWKNPQQRPSWYHNMLSIVQAGVCTTSNQLDYDEEVAFKAVRQVYDYARDRNSDPFFLLVSFTHPHDPFAITQQYWDLYPPHLIDLPVVSPIEYADLDPHSQRLYQVCDLGSYQQSDDRVRQARHAYYGMVSYVDDKVGQLTKALSETDLDHDTIVVFLSDHGEMLGERGLWYKMSFFEHASRIPLLFWAPDRFRQQRVTNPVSLVDLLPTLAELGGAQEVEPEPMLDGQSLVAYLDGVQSGVRPVYGEILCEAAVAPLLMIRRGRYKYVYSEPDPEQLYDLDIDPHELVNLASDPGVEPILRDFRLEAEGQWDVKKLEQAVLTSQQRRRFVHAALNKGKHVPWDFQPLMDASQQYMRNHLDLNVLERTTRIPTPEIPPQDGPCAPGTSQ